VAIQNHNGEKVIATKATAAESSYKNCFMVYFVVIGELYHGFRHFRLHRRYFDYKNIIKNPWNRDIIGLWWCELNFWRKLRNKSSHLRNPLKTKIVKLLLARQGVAPVRFRFENKSSNMSELWQNCDSHQSVIKPSRECHQAVIYNSIYNRLSPIIRDNRLYIIRDNTPDYINQPERRLSYYFG
jgi:hypothetical protein